MFLLLLLSVIFLSIVSFIIWSTSRRKYWLKKNVPYANPTPILGNYGDYILLKQYMGKVAQKICQKFPDEPYVGTFYGTEPALLIQDPDIIRLVMTKDFYYFSSREISKYCHKEVMTQNLFFTYGDRWKITRQNLTPLFSSAKMKNMFYLIERSAHEFEALLDYETNLSMEINSRSLIDRFTMDSICSCAFGIDTRTMEKDPKNNPFTIVAKQILDCSHIRAIKWISRAIWPSVFYGLGFKNFPVQVDKFFSDLLMNVFKVRQFKVTSRNDFIDLVLTLRQNTYIVGDSITNAKGDSKKIQLEVNDDLLLAQCILFFAAGYETTSTTLTYLLYELAKNADAQENVLHDVDNYLLSSNNKLQYDCVTGLTYAEACIDETLRLYPVLGMLTREVVEDYTMPSGLRIEKASRVHIPVYHMHMNPKYFPEPNVFKPERFLGEAKRNIKPYTFMPFGEGPRICIGMRFAKMQLMAGLITILKKYRVELADGMPRSVELDPRPIVTTPIGGIHLKLTPREGWEQRLFSKAKCD